CRQMYGDDQLRSSRGHGCGGIRDVPARELRRGARSRAGPCRGRGGPAMSELTLTHALGEIEAGPSGPGVGAFFDLDGTLIEGFSAKVFVQHRLRNREIGAAELARTLRVGLD